MYKHHVFISYAHIDNLPLSDEQQGWITRFHQTFSVFLSQRLGGEARIWRDQKLQGNDIFGAEIEAAFRASALLVSVFSPRYVRSEWCTREVAEFCVHAEGGHGLVLSNKSRVFKVVKTPVHDSASPLPLPPVVRDSLGYDFYVQDDQGPIELDPDFGEAFKQDYLRKVCIVANNAARLIVELEACSQSAAPVAAPSASAPRAPAAGKPASRSGRKRGTASPPAAEAGQPPKGDSGVVQGETQQSEPAARPSSGPVSDTTADPPLSPSRRSVVFLAATSFDLRDQREWIEADLRDHGYRVLPEERLPSEEEAEHRQAVAPLLEQARLSVHLIGASYGAVPDGPGQQSLVELHNALAAQRSREQGLQRLIWVPQGLTSQQPNQQRFLEALRQQAELQAGADLLDGSLEDLRTLLHASLDRLEQPPPPSPVVMAEEGQAAMVYLITVQSDRRQSLPLRKWLRGEGFDVSLPAFDGDATAVRQAHEALLRDCTAAVIFYGDGDEAWYRSVTVDLRRALVYRGGRPLPQPFTVLAAPDGDDKQDMVDLEEDDLIDLRQGYTELALAPLLRRLRAAAGEP